MSDLEDIEKLNRILKQEEDERNEKDGLFDLIDNYHDNDDDDEAVTHPLEDEREYPCVFEDCELIEGDADVEEEGSENDFDLCEDESEKLKNSLLDEDRKIIDECQDAFLKSVMIANRAKYMKLVSMNNYLVRMLTVCKHKISCEEGKLLKPLIFQRSMSLGYPYFKDSKYYPSPWNKDVYRKKQNNELIGDFLYIEQVNVYWTPRDKKRLESTVKKLYLQHVKSQMENVIQMLRKGLEGLKEKSERELVQRQIANKEMDLIKVQAYPIQQVPRSFFNKIDWERISTKEMNGRMTPMECKSFWCLYLDPAINKDPYTYAETKKLKTLAEAYKFQNWDEIAVKLGTKRTGYMVCSYFFTTLFTWYDKSRRFTPEEDELLKKVVGNFRRGSFVPWSVIPYYFQNRSKMQLYNRYHCYLRENTVKGKFTTAEDILIKYLHKKFHGNWNKISAHVPDRSVIQIKDHYKNMLKDKKIPIAVWSVEDDQKLMDHVDIYGDQNWPLAHKLLETGRNTASLRHRYKIIMRWKDNNPGKSVKDAPRRSWIAQRNDTKMKEHTMKVVLDKLERDTSNVIPDKATVERYLKDAEAGIAITDIRLNGCSEEDRALIEYFQLQEMKTRHGTKMDHQQSVSEDDSEEMQEATNGIRSLLNILGANLELPSENIIEGVPTLDVFDKRILRSLKEEGDSFSGSDQVGHLLPPNCANMMAFRNIIIDMNCLKSKNQSIDSEEPDAAVDNDADLDSFYQRFKSILMWPALMAITDVPASVKEVPPDPGKKRKKAGRPYNSERFWKIEMMNKKRLQKRGLEASGIEEEAEKEAEVAAQAKETQPPIAKPQARVYQRKKKPATTLDPNVPSTSGTGPSACARKNLHKEPMDVIFPTPKEPVRCSKRLRDK